MSNVDIVLPPLTTWAEERLRAIFNAEGKAQLTEAFDAFVAPHAHITVNGASLSRAQYLARFANEEAAERSQDPAQVSFSGAVASPSTANQSGGVGTAGLFYKATIFGRFFVFGAPNASTVTGSLNIVVAEDKSLKPPTIGRGGGFDARRVVTLNEVSTDEAVPITLPHGGAPAPSV